MLISDAITSITSPLIEFTPNTASTRDPRDQLERAERLTVGAGG